MSDVELPKGARVRLLEEWWGHIPGEEGTVTCALQVGAEVTWDVNRKIMWTPRDLLEEIEPNGLEKMLELLP